MHMFRDFMSDPLVEPRRGQDSAVDAVRFGSEASGYRLPPAGSALTAIDVSACVCVCVGNPNYNGNARELQRNAGGARDACRTGNNEDASIASVKRVRTLTRVPPEHV